MLATIFNFLVSIYRALFARPSFRVFNTAIFRMGLSGLGIRNFENNRVSGERFFLETVLKRNLKNASPIFLDVGANIGNYAAELAVLYPQAQIHCFEPQSNNFARLQTRFTSKNIRSHNLALGDTPGRMILHDRADANGSEHATFHQAVITELYKIEVVGKEVEIETVARFAARENLSFIDFLKIDTEGHELAVLQGAKEMLEAGKIGCIHFEFNEMNVISRVFLRDFRKLLSNYDLYRLLPNGLLSINNIPLESELFAYQNIVAIPKAS